MIKLQVDESTILLECDDKSHTLCQAQWTAIPLHRGPTMEEVSILTWIINYGKEHAHNSKPNVEHHEKH